MFLANPRLLLIIIISHCFLLDNITLTAVVPIIPDYLLSLDLQINQTAVLMKQGLESQTFILDGESENSRVGLLLSSKAIVQLILNPVVGAFTNKIGFFRTLLFGTFILFLTNVSGKTYKTLFFARSLQGLASACIIISGMSLVAEKYLFEPQRSRAIGFVLGVSACGILLGYPFGGFLYNFFGKSTPFAILSFIISLLTVIEFYHFEKVSLEMEFTEEPKKLLSLLTDSKLLLYGGAIGISTSAMAILEPCLPIWLLEHIKSEKWQLGTVFVPDSIGYVLGTNIFALLNFDDERIKVAVFAMILEGISTLMIPLATSLTQLLLPHFLLGLSIGIVDAALVPLLASIADEKRIQHYGTVYAAQQFSVSLAYALGPMLGGVAVKWIGFPLLMASVGLFNIFYGFILLYQCKETVDLEVKFSSVRK